MILPPEKTTTTSSTANHQLSSISSRCNPAGAAHAGNLHPHDDPKTRLLANLMESPRASDGVDHAGNFDPARILRKATALTKRLIQFNGPKKLTYIVYDIDREDAAFAWSDRNQPAPNLIMQNPANGHCHYAYELAEPIWLRGHDQTNRLDRPVHYMECVRVALGEALGADPRFNGLLVKNPFHPSWRVYSGRSKPYRLSELHQHVELDHTFRSRAQRQNSGDGRDSGLFDQTRLWAYQHRDDYSTLADFTDGVAQQVERVNDSFDQPIDQSSRLRSVVKSVSRWVWHRWVRGGGTKRVRDRLPAQEVERRQRQAGQQTRQAWETDTTGKLRSAIAYLTEHGQKTSRAAIAARAGLSVRTVIRYATQVRALVTEYGNLTLGLQDHGGDSLKPATPLSPPTPHADALVTPPAAPPAINDLAARIRWSISNSNTKSSDQTVAIIRTLNSINNRTAIRYSDILRSTDDDPIKAAIVVCDHARNGQFVTELPSGMERIVIRHMMLKAAA